MNLCIKWQRNRACGRRSSDEPTHWIEVPQSSHLPVDIEASDPPEDRMRISKRPAAETMGIQEDRSLQSQYQERPEKDQERASSPSPPSKQDEDTPQIQKPFVLLVDDNDINLQLLCAYVQKDGFCCDMRLVQIKNRAAPSELIPGISIRSIKLIGNQLDILVVYIASCIPSERITIKSSSESQHVLRLV